MEFIISISRPGKSWNLSEGHGKSWKINMPSENKKIKELKKKHESATTFNFSRNRHKHAFYVFLWWKMC